MHLCNRYNSIIRNDTKKLLLQMAFDFEAERDCRRRSVQYATTRHLAREKSCSISLLMTIFAEQSAVASLKETRARLAARPSGPYQTLRFVQSWVARAPPRFRMRSLPFSREAFKILAPR